MPVDSFASHAQVLESISAPSLSKPLYHIHSCHPRSLHIDSASSTRNVGLRRTSRCVLVATGANPCSPRPSCQWRQESKRKEGEGRRHVTVPTGGVYAVRRRLESGLDESNQLQPRPAFIDRRIEMFDKLKLEYDAFVKGLPTDSTAPIHAS